MIECAGVQHERGTFSLRFLLKEQRSLSDSSGNPLALGRETGDVKVGLQNLHRDCTRDHEYFSDAS